MPKGKPDTPPAGKPAEPTKISFSLLDGREFGFETRTHMCPADRYEFERRFQISAGQLAQIADEAGEGDTSGMQETWIMFFAWRCAVREVREVAQMGFEDFASQLAAYDTDLGETGPTVPEAVTA